MTFVFDGSDRVVGEDKDIRLSDRDLESILRMREAFFDGVESSILFRVTYNLT
jgi:hypothetical protein